MSIFTGAGVAIITPFNEDGSINFEEFERLLKIRLQDIQMQLSYVVQQVNHQLWMMMNILQLSNIV